MFMGNYIPSFIEAHIICPHTICLFVCLPLNFSVLKLGGHLFLFVSSSASKFHANYSKYLIETCLTKGNSKGKKKRISDNSESQRKFATLNSLFFIEVLEDKI